MNSGELHRSLTQGIKDWTHLKTLCVGCYLLPSSIVSENCSGDNGGLELAATIFLDKSSGRRTIDNCTLIYLAIVSSPHAFPEVQGKGEFPWTIPVAELFSHAQFQRAQGGRKRFVLRNTKSALVEQTSSQIRYLF